MQPTIESQPSPDLCHHHDYGDDGDDDDGDDDDDDGDDRNDLMGIMGGRYDCATMVFIIFVMMISLKLVIYI